MKINFTDGKNINFGCRQLCSAKVVKRTLFGAEKAVDAFVSELEASDIDKVKSLKKFWDKTKYGKRIINNFLEECKNSLNEIGKKKRFFVVECPDRKGVPQVKAMALAEVLDEDVYVSYVQSSKKHGFFGKLKGLGSCIMYGIAKTAQTLKKEAVDLNSDRKATEFYDKLGFEDIFGTRTVYSLYSSEFKSFLQDLEKKFSIKNIKG